MTQAQLAKRMGITQQNAAALETDELNGNITIARLERAAEGLNCELRYLLVPKKPLGETVANQAHLEHRGEESHDARQHHQNHDGLNTVCAHQRFYP